MTLVGNNSHVRSALADPRLQRLLTICQQINAIRSKINVATKYIESAGTTGDTENVVLAREVLWRDLERDFAEARELMPVIDELVSRLEVQIRSLEERKRVHEGLAKIEDLSGAITGPLEEGVAAGKAQSKISELENLIAALDNLEKDMSLRKEVISCPRCASHEISYRITPSELGFSLYRCNRCGNAWRTMQFTMQVGLPAQ